MTPLGWVQAVAVAAGVLALAAGAAPRFARARDALLRVHAAATLACLAWLATSFLGLDLGLSYVWAHTRADHAWPYRLAGIWGGEEGTILLWNAFVSVIVLALVRRAARDPDPLHGRALSCLAAFSTTLGVVGLVSGTFDATTPDQLARAPAGRGLAEVLLTPLMVIHPPVQFAAYALLAPVGAYVLAMLTGPSPAPSRAWAERAFAWARLAWFLGTLGLGLGALWAYYVLSFGGYWSWDPVETSNLLPWLALTAFLHAGKHHLRYGDHPLATPALGYGAFVLTLFATLATRSGLWVSVHAFTDPTDRFEPDALARLLAIVDAHVPSRAFLGLLLVALFAGAALLLRHESRRAGRAGRAYATGHAALLFALAGAGALDPAFVVGLLAQAGALAPHPAVGFGLVIAFLVGTPFVLAYLGTDERRAFRLDARAAMAFGVGVLAVATLVTMLVMVQVVNGTDRLVYDLRAPFVALPLASALTFALALGPMGARRAGLLAGAGALLGALAWALVPQARVLALATPVLLAAAVAALARIAASQGRAQLRMRVAGAMLLLSSVLGLALWANPPTYVLGVSIPGWTSVPLGILGTLLSLAALLGALASLRGRGHRLAMWGAAAGALALGYGVGTLLALAAAGLLALERRRFGAFSWRAEAPRLREAGMHLVHLALVLGLLGYAASTYSQERATFAALPLDGTAPVGDHALRLAGAQPTLDASGRLDSLRVVGRLTHDGDPSGEADLVFTWAGTGYDGALAVQRGLWRDVYVSPLAFHTAQGWVGADSAASGKASPEGVDAVTVSVSVLPLMSLVWMSLWGMLAGMGLVLLARALGADETVGRAVPVAAQEPVVAVGHDRQA